jgi:hypothetical protein
MGGEALPFLVRFNGADIRSGTATKDLNTFYDKITTGQLAFSDDDVLRDLENCLAAGDPWGGVAGDCIILWARAMGRDDIDRILREGRGAFVEITGTPDDFDLAYGSTYKQGQPRMWPNEEQTILVSGRTLEELLANYEAVGLPVDIADLEKAAAKADGSDPGRA